MHCCHLALRHDCAVLPLVFTLLAYAGVCDDIAFRLRFTACQACGIVMHAARTGSTHII